MIIGNNNNIMHNKLYVMDMGYKTWYVLSYKTSSRQ